MSLLAARTGWVTVRALGLATLVACGPGDPPPTPAAGPGEGLRAGTDVVLVTIDTLRADHLGCYGYPRNTSPFLDGLAARGARFDQAISSSSQTAPAHATLFTSLYPVQHRLLMNGYQLQSPVQTLAERLTDAGYQTAAFTSVNFLRAMEQGFEVFRDDQSARARKDGRVVVRQAIQWLSQRTDPRPLFLWIHLFEPHQPYGSNDTPFFQELVGTDQEARTAYLDLLRDRGVALTEDTARPFVSMHNSYDAEVRTADELLRRVHESLHQGDGPPAWWLILSDHGEGLGQHQYRGHDDRIYNEQLRVPWILHHTEDALEPRVVTDLVRTVDVAPTLLDLLQIPVAAEGLQGRSLVPLFEDGASLEVARAFSERRPLNAATKRQRPSQLREQVLSLQDGRFKFIYHSKAGNELYDLRTDPYEQQNLVGQGHPAEAALEKLLLDRYQAWSEAARGEPAIHGDGYQEELEALGYVGDDG